MSYRTSKIATSKHRFDIVYIHRFGVVANRRAPVHKTDEK